MRENAGYLTDAASGHVPPGTPIFLLGFSSLSNGGKGESVIALGNPDTATHVSGFIEGVGSAPSNMPIDNAAAILNAEDARYGDGTHNAMVIYQAGPMPATIPEGLNQNYAETYAPRYAAYINSVIQSHGAVSGSPANYTLFSHSYGTEVLTQAAQHHALSHVGSMTMLASPSVHADSTSSHGINPDHVYAATAHGDPIGYDANAGTQISTYPLDKIPDIHSAYLHDPTTFAHTFHVDPGGHSSYFTDHGDLSVLGKIAETGSP